MNTYGAVETTDKTLFMQCNDEETYNISIDDIEKLIVYHDQSNGNVPHSPESTNMTIAGQLKKEYAFKRIFTKDVVKAHISGDMHLHNTDMIDRVYCSSHSPSYVGKFGLSLPNLNSIAKPAKHADVFLEQIIKFAASMQGHFSGAIGFDAVNMFVAPYIVGKTDKEVKQLAQILVYEFAQQAVARGSQVIFSDLNLYWDTPKHYANTDAVGPGGVSLGIPYKEFENESKAFLRALMQVYLDGDAAGRPFFFPKPDCHISETSVKDEEYMNLLAEVAAVRGSPYFVFDRGADPRLAQCCFDSETKVLIKDNESGVRSIPMKDVRAHNNAKVFHNGSWVGFKRVETSKQDKKMFKIRTIHGKELIATEDHIFPTLRGDIRLDNMNTEDYVLFNTRSLQNEPYYEHGMSYSQGVMIGAFLGDGSYGERGLNYSLNKEKYDNLNKHIEKGYEEFTGVHKDMTYSVVDKLYACRITLNDIEKHIAKWVNGRYASDKSPNLNCLAESVDFRKGIIDGWGMTDGGNSHRIYSISKDMIDGFEAILTSLGIQCRTDLTDRRDEVVIIRGETFNHNYPLYCLRIYDTKQHRNKENIYKVRNNSVWFKVESIEEMREYDKDTVYCLEMVNKDEPYFTMPSGWIVHNCRLSIKMSKTDTDELVEPWKLRFSALQNVSMNLPGMAFQTKDEDKFYELLESNLELAGRAHMQKFGFIDRLIEMGNSGPLGLLTMTHDGLPYLRYDKMKFLVGMVGMNEAVQMLCGEQIHESKEAFKLGLKITAKLGDGCAAISKEHGFATSLEQTPAESTAYRFAKLDKARFGSAINPYLRGNIDGDNVYYTNSTQINTTYNISPIERTKMEGKFHPLIDAGSITHVWLGEYKPSVESIAAFVKKTHESTTNSQITFSPEFTSCVDCNKTSRGLNSSCPYCGSKNVDGITRITGYFAKITSKQIDNLNKGKAQEIRDRYKPNL